MAIIDNPKTLDLSDIQGMVTRGYGKLMNTAYLHLNVTDAAKGRAWIKSMLPVVDSGEISPNSPTKVAHLAFTYQGLLALGMDEENARQFPNPFREGIAAPNRSRILGDYGESDPENWFWGGEQEGYHILLILHAKNPEGITAWVAKQKDGIAANEGITVTRETTGYQPTDDKEPFGFHDGISQPTIKGSGRPGPDNGIVETGEFLMGYTNEHNQIPYSPLLQTKQGNTTLLKDNAAGIKNDKGEVCKDLGHNGTYMVYRQIEQHVEAFWKYMEDQTRNADGSVNEAEKIKLAAKIIGRWPSGASLVNFPDADPGGSPANDDFGYADLDPDGLRCPYASHLRRNNPRDNFRWYDKKKSLQISARHRIVRRGRVYEGQAGGGQTDKEIGLHFICFNANLELQFEFIQHAWANNNQLRHLSNDIDLIIGAPQELDPNGKHGGQFTIQAEPVNQTIDGWERFVTIRGGQYYFMPSITVLNYLTTLGD